MKAPYWLVIAGCLSGFFPLWGCAAAPTVPETLSAPQAEELPITAVKTVSVVQGLEHPWGMAWLPNGDILITERPGRLRRVRNGKLDPNPIPGVSEVSTIGAQQVFASQQGGLLDIAVHPRFQETGWLYFSYAHGDREANRTRVARGKFDGEVLQNWEVIFEVGQSKKDGQHFGSRLVWLPDQTLLVSIGDGGNPPVQLEGKLIRLQAQNLGSHLGKVIRITEDGKIPPDNPFLNRSGAAPEVWSYGHRNIQGMAYDPLRGKVWATEHGSRGGDELNEVRKGENYGWPLVSFSLEYSAEQPVAPKTADPAMIPPQRVWTPAIAPSGLAVYTGDRFPQWRGNLFLGGLVSRSLHRLELDGTGRIQRESRVPIGERTRDARQGPDGYLYVLTDENPGQLLRLTPE
ncbi:MAG: PQQ-dependent sugar dehydrogenase [Cyanobacteriota bacterium]|jgi:glucose/arabinose dehydrogenase